MAPVQQFYRYIKLALFAIYFINGVIIIQSNSVVSDEGDHLSYALRVLKGQSQKVVAFEDASTMPISVLNALPRAAEQVLNPGLQKKDGGKNDILNGRYITLIICSLIGFFVYKWGKETGGEKAGLFSLFLFVLCPNLNANIGIIGTDAYTALFTLSSAYYFRKFALEGGWKYFILFSIHLGIAQITKQSLLLLFPFYGLLSLALLIYRKSFFKNFKQNLIRLLALIAIVLLVVNAGFLFSGFGTPLKEYSFQSQTFLKIQQIPYLKQIPLPLPVPFLSGFDEVKQMLTLGSGNPVVSARSYLLGKYFSGNDIWYYYSIVFLFKTPLAVLFFLLVSLLSCLRSPFTKVSFFAVGFPLLLAFFFFFLFSMLNTSQHGIRHLVLVFPLLYVVMGPLINRKFLEKKVILILFLAYSITTFYYYFPNLLSYTNELIWNKKNAYKVLASANIDAGQCVERKIQYLTQHPGYKVPGNAPESGNFIIGINDYLDLKQTGMSNWIREFKPIAHLDHCFLLFNITKKDLADKEKTHDK